jgi:UDP-3-O-[3-hydroxymyristoyl] glucosamine N-acyltransferase
MNNFNPVDFIYLNPEIELSNSLTTVEKANDYYKNGGSNSNLYSNVKLPTNWNYKIYLKKNENIIKSNLGSLYTTYSNTDPERVAIIHNVRYNKSNLYEYSIKSDFKTELFRTFNDIGTKYWMPSDYYIDYLSRSNNGVLENIQYGSMGTVSDFMLSFLENSFTEKYVIRSDLVVTGRTTSCNLTITDTATINNAILNNLSVDTLTVNDYSFVDSIFQDNVRLTNNLTVLGSNVIFSNNLQVKDLLVLNTSQFDNNVLLNKKLTVKDISTFNSNVIINSNLDVYNNETIHKDLYVNNNTTIYGSLLNYDNVQFNSELLVKKNITLNSNVFINNNVFINSNVGISNNLIVNGITTLNSNVYIYKPTNFNDIGIFNNGLTMTGIGNLTTINIDDLKINNSLQVINDAVFSNNLTVNKNLNIKGNVVLNGNVTISNLTVLDRSILNDLQVIKDVSFSNNLLVSKNIIATEYITLSDYRIKKNIKNFDKEEAKILINNLNVKEYDFINQINDKKNIGLIAQEVELLTNLLVRNSDNYIIKINKYVNKIDSKKYSMDDKLLSSGDIILYSYNENEEQNKYRGVITFTDKNSFILEKIENDLNEDYSNIYIHERIINNFKSINYTEIIMLCVSCIQDINKRLDKIEDKISSPIVKHKKFNTKNLTIITSPN